MRYYSTNKESSLASFKEATIKGQAPDKGLYFPESIPQVEKDLIDNIEDISNEEIAFRVIKTYVGDEIKEDDLFKIVSETINFPIPLVKVNHNIFSLELFHGPTLAFKDVGARFMSRCLGLFLKNENKKVKVLVATSGDTCSGRRCNYSLSIRQSKSCAGETIDNTWKKHSCNRDRREF